MPKKLYINVNYLLSSNVNGKLREGGGGICVKDVLCILPLLIELVEVLTLLNLPSFLIRDLCCEREYLSYL